MISYLPWSKKVLDECIIIQKSGGIAALDLDFTSQCSTCKCVYCDSKPLVGKKSPKELTIQEVENILEDGKTKGMKWIYSCGLGEPMEDEKFVATIEKAHSLDIQVSIFSNGVLIDSLDKAEWLHRMGVSVILKLDTFVEKDFDKILGIKGTAKKIYQALDYLLKAGYGRKLDGNCTMLAFSIVPTNINIDDIEEIFTFAIANNIFPSIGELEKAGLANIDRRYNSLEVNTKLVTLKKRIDELWGGSYCRPMCPVILNGIHINHIGECITDNQSALNCKWFMLEESIMDRLGSVRDESIDVLFRRINTKRRRLFEENKNIIDAYGCVDHLFGGCGGSPKNIISLAKKLLKNEL